MKIGMIMEIGTMQLALHLPNTMSKFTTLEARTTTEIIMLIIPADIMVMDIHTPMLLIKPASLITIVTSPVLTATLIMLDLRTATSILTSEKSSMSILTPIKSSQSPMDIALTVISTTKKMTTKS